MDAGAGDLAHGEEAQAGPSRRRGPSRSPPARWCAAGAIGSHSTAGSRPAAARLADSVGNRAANSSSPVASSQRCPTSSRAISDAIARLTTSRGASSSTNRSPAALRRSAPWPRSASERSGRGIAGWCSAVGWNCMNSTSQTATPARSAIASPSPVAADGFVVTSYELPRAAGREDHARRLELVAARLRRGPRGRGSSPSSTSRPTATACSRISATVPWVAATSARSTSAPVAAPPACRIRAWEWPPSRARCRTPVASRSKTAPSAISSSTRGGPSLDEDAHRVDVAQPRTGSERVGEVQVRRVLVVVEDRRDAALRPSRRRLRERRLGDDAHLAAGVGEPDRDGEAGHAAPDDERVEAHEGPTTAATLSSSRTPSTVPATSSRTVAPDGGSTAARSVEGSTAAA